MDRTVKVDTYYGSLEGMLAKYDKYARQDAFHGTTLNEFCAWQKKMRNTLGDLIGLPYMESCPLNPSLIEVKEVALRSVLTYFAQYFGETQNTKTE